MLVWLCKSNIFFLCKKRWFDITLSILTYDPNMNTFGGASMTGNLCVGAWVLRGDPFSGLSASQGKLPSTLWGEDVLFQMGKGMRPRDAISKVISSDHRRDERQLLALDKSSEGAAFSGDQNISIVSEIIEPNLVVAGNMLKNASVAKACASKFLKSSGGLTTRLVMALEEAASVGGDMRGLKSAAILIISPDTPPIDLRIDYSEEPLGDLKRLIDFTNDVEYLTWRNGLPTHKSPYGMKI